MISNLHFAKSTTYPLYYGGMVRDLSTEYAHVFATAFSSWSHCLWWPLLSMVVDKVRRTHILCPLDKQVCIQGCSAYVHACTVSCMYVLNVHGRSCLRQLWWKATCKCPIHDGGLISIYYIVSEVLIFFSFQFKGHAYVLLIVLGLFVRLACVCRTCRGLRMWVRGADLDVLTVSQMCWMCCWERAPTYWLYTADLLPWPQGTCLRQHSTERRNRLWPFILSCSSNELLRKWCMWTLSMVRMKRIPYSSIHN